MDICHSALISTHLHCTHYWLFIDWHRSLDAQVLVNGGQTAVKVAKRGKERQKKHNSQELSLIYCEINAKGWKKQQRLELVIIIIVVGAAAAVVYLFVYADHFRVAGTNGICN